MAETMKAQAQEIERLRMELQRTSIKQKKDIPELTSERRHSGIHVKVPGGVRPGGESDPVDVPVCGRAKGVPRQGGGGGGCSGQRIMKGPTVMGTPPRAIMYWPTVSGVLCGGRSSDKRASSHPRPGGGPTAVLPG